MTTALVCLSHSPLMHCFDQPPAEWDNIQASYKCLRNHVEAFAPELVIMFGSDHYNGFFRQLMPAFCVGLQAQCAADIGGYEGPLRVPRERAEDLVASLYRSGIDAAVSAKMTLDHAFSQTLKDLTGALAAYPTIPVFINCMNAPYVPFARVRALGEAVGAYCQAAEKRVLLLGSGGMSHNPRRYYPAPEDAEPAVAAWQLSGGDEPGSLDVSQWLERLDSMHREGARMITRGERTAKDMRLNAEADHKFLDILLPGRLREFDTWEPQQLIETSGIGATELNTWIAATAAHVKAGGALPQLDTYSVAPEIGIAFGAIYA